MGLSAGATLDGKRLGNPLKREEWYHFERKKGIPASATEWPQIPCYPKGGEKESLVPTPGGYPKSAPTAERGMHVFIAPLGPMEARGPRSGVATYAGCGATAQIDLFCLIGYM